MRKVPSAARVALVGAGILALRKDDFILAAFPRSGSTWMRHVLCNLISLNELDGRNAEQLLDATMPALGASNLFRKWPYRTIPRVIKTHRQYSPVFRGIPSFGLVRDPRDVMVSRYHLMRDKRGELAEPFDRFIRDSRNGLESWFKHYASWRRRWRVALKYEDLLDDPQTEFARLLDTLGADCSDDVLAEAIARSSFERLQGAEKRRKPSRGEQGLFFRSGSAGQWRDYFDRSDIAYADRVAARFGVSVHEAAEP
jgi:hypothetical protein